MIHIGIDVAKYHHDAIGLDDAGRIVFPAFRFENTRPGVEQLQEKLQTWQPTVHCALESTGHYWLALHDYLTNQGVKVIVFNPLQIQAYRQVGLRKAKTDRIDCFYIADFLRTRPADALRVLSPHHRQLRYLARFRFRLADRLAASRRRAHRLLDQVFPEYPSLFARPFVGTSRLLLRQTVSSIDFQTWALSDLTALIRQASRGRLGQEKAQAILNVAHISLGISTLGAVASLEMNALLQQMDLLEQQQARVEQMMADILAEIPQFLTTIPGISTTLAAAILGEIGDVHRFPSIKELVAFAGLDPSVHQSGQFQATNTRLSKRGSPYLRRAVWIASLSARRFDPDLAAFYQRKRQQGKHFNLAMGAVCHRLLARIYVILKENRPYQIRK